jgi:aerobic-type carbon monoxide dehydrogenase small subunit (CoxS/CutS family)
VDSGTHAADKSMKQRQAFWDENAFQCGYCLSGMLFAAQDLLERNPDATEGEIRAAIAGNLCRCTGYESIVAGVRFAARSSPKPRLSRAGGGYGPRPGSWPWRSTCRS